MTARLVIVGAGPRALGLLERLAASAPELVDTGGVEVHLVDPYPPGAGRIWRREQSPLLWMNTRAGETTVFTDATVACDGPIRTGPTVAEWVYGPGAARLGRAGLDAHVELLTSTGGGHGFASRAILGEYLGWAFEWTIARLPAWVDVLVHRTTAVAVEDVEAGLGFARQRVRIADGTQLCADVVVLAQGHLDREASPRESAYRSIAEVEGLTYVPPGYTADVELSGLRAGEPVLVSGLGLAFVDLFVLLTQGRGGRFEEAADGELTYVPSGREPVLHVGSRRGVPFHAKPGYDVPGLRPTAARYLTPEAIDALALARSGDPGGQVDMAGDVQPLIEKELVAAHYGRLFAAHPQRVRGRWSDLELLLADGLVDDARFVAAIEAAVPDARDRFDIGRLDRPLAGRDFADRAELQEAVVEHVRADLERRADPEHSADLAVYNALITVHLRLAELVATGRLSPADRVRHVEGGYTGFFSFLASGPPPRRLRELLAVHRAGLLSFLGPDLEVTLRDGQFVGRSAGVPGEVRARAYVEARLPRPDVLAAADPVIRGLLDRGELAAERLEDDAGAPLPGGQLLTDHTARAVRADGSVHPSRFLIGPAVSGSAGAGGFARPCSNAPGLRQNDAVARDILRLLAAAGQANDPARPAAKDHRDDDHRHDDDPRYDDDARYDDEPTPATLARDRRRDPDATGAGRARARARVA